MDEDITLDELIEENGEEIEAIIRRRFDEVSCKMNHYVADTIDELLRSECKIYEWVPDDCPYDDSGSLRYPGKPVTPETNLGDFLSGCTGESVATYVSGSGMFYPDWEHKFTDDDTDWNIRSAYWSIASAAFYQWLEDSGVPVDEEVAEECSDASYELLWYAVEETASWKCDFLFENRERTIADFLAEHATGLGEIAAENRELYDAELRTFIAKLEAEADCIPLEKKFTINATDKKFMENLYKKYTQREVSLLVWRDRLGTPRGRKFFDFQRIVREEIEAEEKRLEDLHRPISINPIDYFELGVEGRP